MKKLLCIFLIWGVFAQLCCAISAESYALYDVFKGEFIAGENIDTPMLFASTTKIMTALVAIEFGNLDREMTVSEKAAAVDGSQMGLLKKQKISFLYISTKRFATLRGVSKKTLIFLLTL